MVLLTILLTADIGTAQAQQVALKTNLLYDATTTPNIGAEMGIGKKSTVQLFYGLNPCRFEGWYVGGGVSYGYQWVLSRHWNFEASIGVGAAYIDYGKFKCGECGAKIDDGHKIYVGPTKLALSLLYMF